MFVPNQFSMLKKITTFILLSAFVLNICFAYTSADVTGANYLASKKIIKDWSSNPVNYRFDDYIARSEIMGMALAMAGVTRNTHCRGDFVDVPKSDVDWVCRTIETAADKGFINAKPTDMKARPYDNVSRAESVGILLKTFPDGGAWAGYSYYWDANFPVNGDSVGYKDAYAFGAEWQARVFYDYIRKVLRDDTQLRVNPRASSAATRREVFEFAKAIMEKDDLTSIPEAYTLSVPFTPQAPTGNWDAVHNEACEEASVIMAYAYFSDHTETTLSPEFVEAEISKLIDWEKEHFGYYLDSDAAETARMLREVYGLKTNIITDYTEEDLKNALSDNKVIIYFGAGRMLGNPYYRNPGPLYHVLVIKGYTDTKFITNDPGTKN